MRKILDDLTYEEVQEEHLYRIEIKRVSDGKPFMKPLEISDITASKIKNSLIEVANKVG